LQPILKTLSCFAPNLTPVCERCVGTYLLTYSLHFNVFYMERQPYVLHSVFTPTWTTIIYNNLEFLQSIHSEDFISLNINTVNPMFNLKKIMSMHYKQLQHIQATSDDKHGNACSAKYLDCHYSFEMKYF
jgi:hypothetical protein